MNDVILSVRDLRVAFQGKNGDPVEVVRGISFDLRRGRRLALVGESGCGKSMTSLSIARLPPLDRARVGGEVLFEGNPVTGPCEGISYVFQDPIGSLNPVMRIRDQMREARRGSGVPVSEMESLLREVDLKDPGRVLASYPCELSGGMCQRVMIAMALAAEPRLLIADEPTTALDVTTQADVMKLLDRIVRDRGMSLLMATHNIGLVSGFCDEMAVLYAGQVVEIGEVKSVLANPRHPYTQGLIRAVPRIEDGRRNTLRDIPGAVPSPAEIAAMGESCAFRPRCPHASEACGRKVEMCGGVRCVGWAQKK